MDNVIGYQSDGKETAANRLTVKGYLGWMPNGNVSIRGNVKAAQDCFDCLAELENAGFTPDELAELSQAKQDGRLVEIVRCRNCINAYYEWSNSNKNTETCRCSKHDKGMLQTDYCSYGQTREATEDALKEAEK